MAKPQVMHAGRLRDRVRIEQPVEKIDSRKQTIRTWEEVDTVWACVEPLSGREIWQMAQVQSDVSQKVTVRYRCDLHAAGGKWRLVWVSCQGFILNIDHVQVPNAGGGRVWLEAYCRGEGVKA